MIHETDRAKIIALSRELSDAFETQKKSKQVLKCALKSCGDPQL
jgi:hypothetical protein